MKVMADTSVLVAAMVEAHPAHARAQEWFNHALARKDETLVCTHTLAELYAVLTRLPAPSRISPDMARRLVRENLEKAGVVAICLDASDYAAVLDRMAALGLSGGVVYDALVVRAAEKAGADRIVTLNEADFRRVCHDSRLKIAAP